jgi:hypothetical protein
MDRYWKSGAAGSPPVHTENASNGYPTAGDPGVGTPATKPGPWWFHMVTEEIRAVIVAAGLTPDKSDTGQLLAALQSQGFFVGAAADDETFTSPAIAANVLTLNLNTARVFKVAANANITTTTIQNPPVNTKVGQFLVKYTADGTLRTWTWFSSTVVWDGGVVPVLPTTNGHRMWALFWTDDGGTTWFGSVIGRTY